MKTGIEYNFDEVTVNERTGTSSQTYLQDFNVVESTKGVNEELKYRPGMPTYSTTQRINDTNVNRVRITITMDSLYKFKQDGDTKGMACDIRVDIMPDALTGGSWQTVVGQGGGFYFFQK